MRILHIINSTHGGGAERIVNDWVISEKKYPIDVLSVLPLPSDKLNNVNYFSLNSSNVYNFFNIFKLFKYVKKYQIIHVHLFPSQLYVALLSLFFKNKKFITTEHNTHNRRRDIKVLYFIDRWMYYQYHEIVAVSDATKENFKKYLTNINIKSIGNGVNLELIKKAHSYSKNDFGFCNSDKILAMISRFSAQKDHKTLIDAMILLPGNIKLLLIGEGKLRSKYEKYVEHLKLDNRVKFLGSRNDVYSIMKRVDLVVQSSFFEGLPLVPIESVISGSLVLVSNVDGMRDLFCNDDVKFKQGSAEDLAKKAKILLFDEKVKNKALKELASFRDLYDNRMMIAKYEKLYEEMSNA